MSGQAWQIDSWVFQIFPLFKSGDPDPTKTNKRCEDYGRLTCMTCCSALSCVEGPFLFFLFGGPGTCCRVPG